MPAKRRALNLVIVTRASDGTWKRHDDHVFDDKDLAEGHRDALARRYPKREFAVRPRKGR